MIENDVKSSKIDNTKPQESKKMKQLTLFDFSKSKRPSLSNKENDLRAVPQSSNKDETAPKSTKKKVTNANDIEEIVMSDDNKENDDNPQKIKQSKSFNNKYFDNLMAKKPKETKVEMEQEGETKVETNIGGINVFENESELKNEQFGDIVMIVELFNNYIKLYEMIMDDTSIKNDIKQSNIDYNRFLNALINDKASDSVEYIQLIIETMASIIINNEDFYKKCNLFNLNMNETIKLNKRNMQDICRIILQIDAQTSAEIASYSDSERHEQDRINCFLYDPNRINHDHGLIRKLLDIEFSDFSRDDKIELFKALCYRMLNLHNFVSCLNELRSKVQLSNSKISDIKAKLRDYEARKADISNNFVQNAEKRKENLGITSEKEYDNKCAEVKRLTKRNDELKAFLNKCERIKPVGRDTENNVYWVFDSMKHTVIRELNEEANNANENVGHKNPVWFKYDCKDLYQLLRHLNKKQTDNVKLVNELKKYQEKCKVEEEAELKKIEKEESKLDISNLIVRRSSRIAGASSKKKTYDTPDDDDDENDDVVEVKSDDRGLIDFDTVDMSPIEVLYNVVNDLNKAILKAGFMLTNEYYGEWKETYKKGMKCEDFKEKFETIRDLFAISFKNFNYRNTLQKFHVGNSIATFEKCIENSKTLSNLFLLIQLFNLNIKWWESADSSVCSICKTKTFKLDENCLYIWCSKCHSGYHSDCFKVDNNEQSCWICEKCTTANESAKHAHKSKGVGDKTDAETGSIEINNYSLRRNRQRVEKHEEIEEPKNEKRQTRNSAKSGKRVSETEDTDASFNDSRETSASSMTSSSSILSSKGSKRRRLLPKIVDNERTRSLRSRTSIQYKFDEEDTEQDDDE